MQQGSLITPRWPEGRMIEELLQRFDPRVILCINALPKFGQIYTAKDVWQCDCCTNVYCELEELKVFGGTLSNVPLTVDFYVELAPVQQEIMDEVNEILQGHPV